MKKSLWDVFVEALKDADGDSIEALHGHKCGPGCWHKQGEMLAKRIQEDHQSAKEGD